MKAALNATGTGILCLLMMCGCNDRSTTATDRRTVTVLIESSPTNLDPRIGTDAQSERIDQLMFDGLVRRQADFGFGPALATSWEMPDAKTVVFHLRAGVHFHDGRTLTARDVKWTLDSMRNGTVISPKAGTFTGVESVEVKDDATAILHLKKTDNSLLANLADGAMGVIPEGSDKNFWRNPIGTGPFRFVSQEVDKEVVLERAKNGWQRAPEIERVRFAVVPDATTRALELQKGSGDIATNALPADMTYALKKQGKLVVESGPGTIVNYLAFNLRDPMLKDVRVRRAVALCINKRLIISALFHDQARPARSLLPEQHWAWNGEGEAPDFNPQEANRILDEAGYRRDAKGVRFNLTIKTSTDETTRLLALALQDQLKQAGIALELRSFEFATFYADITHGAFQLFALRWIGGNEQPDIFSYSYASSRIPPKGANRGYYRNAEMDHLLEEANTSLDRKEQKLDYAKVQQLAAQDLPVVPLIYLDTVIVHSPRLSNVEISPSGDYYYLLHARVKE